MKKEDIKEGDVVLYDKSVFLIGKKLGSRWGIKYYYNTRDIEDLQIDKSRDSSLAFSMDCLELASVNQLRHLHSLMVREGEAVHDDIYRWIELRNNHSININYSVF